MVPQSPSEMMKSCKCPHI